MIIGSIHVDRETGTIRTHRDDYLPETITAVSVRRPAFAACLVFGIGFGGFTAVFSDLLYAGEMATIALASAGTLTFGWQAGQLKLLSRDLRGSELSGVIWGRYASLNAMRREIVRAVTMSRRKGVE